MSGHRTNLRRGSKRVRVAKPFAASEERTPPVATPEPQQPGSEDKPAGVRLFYQLRHWWQALLDPQTGLAAWEALGSVAASARKLPGSIEGSGCFCCGVPWEADAAGWPDGALIITSLPNDGRARIAWLCCVCFSNAFDEKLLQAIERTFGQRPGDLQPIHAGGRA